MATNKDTASVEDGYATATAASGADEPRALPAILGQWPQAAATAVLVAGGEKQRAAFPEVSLPQGRSSYCGGGNKSPSMCYMSCTLVRLRIAKLIILKELWRFALDHDVHWWKWDLRVSSV